MAYIEKYLVLFPDGSMRWLHTDRDNMYSAFREVIGCDCLESVMFPLGFCCMVDESGKVKTKPQPINPLASRFYSGTAYGDPLVGPVVFFRIGRVEGEYDCVPLSDRELHIIEAIIGKRVPQ